MYRQKNGVKHLNQFILPLAKEHKVDFDKSLVHEIKDGEPGSKIILTGKRRLPGFSASFSYKGYETRTRDRDEIIVPQGDKVMIVHRNREAENEFIAKTAKPSFQFYSSMKTQHHWC